MMMIMKNTRQTRQDLQAEPGARTLMSGMQENFTGKEGDDDQNYDDDGDDDLNYDEDYDKTLFCHHGCRSIQCFP